MTLDAAAEPEERSFYLGEGADAAFVTLHPAGQQSATAVVLCPPFGWEEVASYRPRRAWAQSLARAGHPALRLTLPSTGDSGGFVDDPDRLGAWTGAVGAAAAWLKLHAGAGRVVAIGMQLGAMLAYRSAALGSEVDDLVLWSGSARGRALLRQLRAFSKLELEQFFAGLEPPPPLPDGELEAGGFRLSAATVRDLDRLDLTALPLPDAARRRILLLDRDGVAFDAALHRHLVDCGAAVATGAGGGYADMTSHPQSARAAEATFGAVAAWLDQGAAAPPPRPGGRQPDRLAPRLDGGGPRGWSETPLVVRHQGHSLRGVLTEPACPAPGDLCAIWLDTGAVRRIGPSRMWTEAARSWAQRGVPSLRLDIHGIGDADGPVLAYPDDSLFHREHLVRQVLAALDALEARGTGGRFMLVGLCSGAYWAFHACLADARVTSVAMLNCRVLAWKEELAPARYARRLLTERPSLARIRRVVSRALVLEMLRWLARVAWRRISAVGRPARTGAAGGQPGADTVLVDRLLASRARALLLFSEREPLHDELVRSGDMERLQRSPAIAIRRLAVNDHTLRPVWAQRQVQQTLAEALERELALAAFGEDRVSSPVAPA